MITFFRGWRRKFGVAMLALACFLLAVMFWSDTDKQKFKLPMGFATIGAVVWRRILFVAVETSRETPILGCHMLLVIIPLGTISGYLLLSRPPEAPHSGQQPN